MKGHDLISTTNELPADEHHGEVTAGTDVSSQCLLDLPATWHLVELVDRGVGPEIGEQGLDGVAHAASALT
ncbi:unnamed protein product, partial [Linum tenue]